MISRYMMLSLLGLFFMCSSGARAAAPVFADDFSTSALLAEQWKLGPAARWSINDGVLSVSLGGSAYATPTIASVDGAVEISARVKCLDFGTKGGWCGIKVRGILFTLQPAGFWYVYNVTGQKRASGGIETTNPPVVGRWYNFKIIERDNHYTWFVDGRKVANFVEPNKIKGKKDAFSLATSGPATAYDNITITPLPDNDNSSPNVIRNASFEIVPDHVPTYWKPWSISTVPPEVFWKKWRMDETDAYDGKLSLRIESDKKNGVGFFSHDNRMAVGQPCTFSVYLKASKPNFKAELRYWEFLGKWSKKPIVVGTEWKRYSFTLDNPEKMKVRAGLQIWDTGVLWADAAQIEEGTNATPFRISVQDEAEHDGAVAALKTCKPITLMQSDVAPLMDGKLDDTVWGDAKVWPLSATGSDALVQPTDSYMLLVSNVLYVGMRCYDDTIDDLKMTVTNHDSMVFQDDCIEMFLDTNHDKATYYHLAANALGTRFDTGPGNNLEWNRDWMVKTFIGDKFWSVEIAIPLSSMDITPLTSSEWGINLCRAYQKKQEFSSTAITLGLNFHCPEQFPILKWSAGAFTERMIYPQKWKLKKDSNGTLHLVGNVVNRTGRDQNIIISGKIAGAGWVVSNVTISAESNAVIDKKLPVVKIKGNEILVEAVIKDISTKGVLREYSEILPVVSSVKNVVKKKTIGNDYTAGVVPIDPDRRCIMVDGQPFFVLAPLVGVFAHTSTREHTDLIVNHYADNGFRSIMLVAKIDRSWCDTAWSNFFASCQARNVKVIVWPGGFRDVAPEIHKKFINKWKNNPALLAWLPVDEPELYATPEQTQNMIALYKETDPNHPVFMNNTHMGIPSRYAGLPGDIISIDDYLTNREGRKVKEIVRQVDMMNKAAIPSHRPVWMFISGNNLHNHTREPTGGEQIAQTYGCAIAGASGLTYFLGGPANKDDWFAMRQVNHELMILAPVLLSAESAPSVVCSMPNIRFTTKRVGAFVYIIAVNLEDKADNNVRFDVPGLSEKNAVVLFEDRAIEMKNGIIADNFNKHERHVYRVKLK